MVAPGENNEAVDNETPHLPVELKESGYSEEDNILVASFIEKTEGWITRVSSFLAEQGVQLTKPYQFIYQPDWRKEKRKRVLVYTSERILSTLADQHTKGELGHWQKALKRWRYIPSPEVDREILEWNKEDYLEPFTFAHSDTHLIYICESPDHIRMDITMSQMVKSPDAKEPMDALATPGLRKILFHTYWSLVEAEYNLPINSDIGPAIAEYVSQKSEGNSCNWDRGTPDQPYGWSVPYMASLIEEMLEDEEAPLQALLRPDVRAKIQDCFDKKVKPGLEALYEDRFKIEFVYGLGDDEISSPEFEYFRKKGSVSAWCDALREKGLVSLPNYLENSTSEHLEADLKARLAEHLTSLEPVGPSLEEVAQVRAFMENVMHWNKDPMPPLEALTNGPPFIEVDGPQESEAETLSMVLKDYWEFIIDGNHEGAYELQKALADEDLDITNLTFIRETLADIKKAPDESITYHTREVYIEALEALLAHLEKEQ